MVVNVVIISISLALFLYWFRYMCIIILRDRGGRNYAGRIANANHLDFPRAEELLSYDESGDLLESREPIRRETLDRLEEALDRDYRVINYLLQNAAEYCRYRSFEQIVLSLDFYLMRFCYRLYRPLSAQMARSTVLEMVHIVRHLAQSAGERLVTRKA